MAVALAAFAYTENASAGAFMNATAPAGIAAGNLLVIIAAAHEGVASLITPSTWTLLDFAKDPTGNIMFYVFAKVATGGEGAVSIALNSGTSRLQAWYCRITGSEQSVSAAIPVVHVTVEGSTSNPSFVLESLDLDRNGVLSIIACLQDTSGADARFTNWMADRNGSSLFHSEQIDNGNGSNMTMGVATVVTNTYAAANPILMLHEVSSSSAVRSILMGFIVLPPPVAGWKDAATRFRLGIRNYKNVATRFRLAIRNYKNVSLRFRLRVTRYANIALRFVLVPPNYKDVSLRFRQQVQSWADTALRFTVLLLNHADVGLRFHIDVPSWADVATRFNLHGLNWKDVVLRFNLRSSGWADVSTRFKLRDAIITSSATVIDTDVEFLPERDESSVRFEDDHASSRVSFRG